MSLDPYQTPQAEIENDRVNQGGVLYSPAQVGCGVFLGGPAAMIYFLKSNFDTLGKPEYGQKTLHYGVIGALALFALVIFVLPDKTPGTAINVGLVFAALQIVKAHQMTKEQIAQSARYDFQSNWKVFGMGLVCALLNLVIVLPLALLV